MDRRAPIRAIVFGAALFALSACEGGFDLDLRNVFDGFDTTNAVRQATEPRPQADNRGVISYPNYQVAVARRGDTVADVAERVGLSPAELAAYNGLPVDVALRQDEILALPRRVDEPSPATGAITTGPIQPGSAIDITTLAGDAIARAEPVTQPAPAPAATSGKEPVRHKVERGETAYSISRLYNISVRSLADWNGLGPDLAVREGQFLLIPVAVEEPPADEPASEPGSGSPTPEPPSASTPLPDEEIAANVPAPPSPDLGQFQTEASAARMQMPVEGKIIRAFVADKNDGIDIAATPGDTVRAAEDGTVAAITEDTDQVPILVLRHDGQLLTVYANIDAIKVKKGAKVKRGDALAVVRASDPGFLHFEVREGFDAVDPMEFLN